MPAVEFGVVFVDEEPEEELPDDEAEEVEDVFFAVLTADEDELEADDEASADEAEPDEELRAEEAS